MNRKDYSPGLELFDEFLSTLDSDEQKEALAMMTNTESIADCISSLAPFPLIEKMMETISNVRSDIWKTLSDYEKARVYHASGDLESALHIYSKLLDAYQMPIEQRISIIYNLSSILRVTDGIYNMKVFFKKSLKNTPPVHICMLAGRFMQEDDLIMVKMFYEIAALFGYAGGYYGLGIIARKENDEVSSQQYFLRAAKMGSQIAVTRLSEKPMDMRNRKYDMESIDNSGSGEECYDFARYLAQSGSHDDAAYYLKKSSDLGYEYAIVDLTSLLITELKSLKKAEAKIYSEENVIFTDFSNFVDLKKQRGDIIKIITNNINGIIHSLEPSTLFGVCALCNMLGMEKRGMQVLNAAIFLKERDDDIN